MGSSDGSWASSDRTGETHPHRSATPLPSPRRGSLHRGRSLVRGRRGDRGPEILVLRSLRWSGRGSLRPLSNLPERDDGPGHSREKVARAVGAGVEVVLELDGGADAVVAAHDHVVALGLPVAEPPQERSWGLWDFRVVDPDGYYLRVTHGDAREE